jgi:hypothetical protein
MQMSSDGADGHAKGIGDLFVAPLLLMIEDEDSSLDLTEALKLFFDGLLEFALFDLLLGVAVGVGEAFFPGGGVVGERDVGVSVAATAFPLVLGDVDSDAIEISGDESFSAKAGKGAIEAEEDVLGEIVEVFVAAGEAQEGAEDHRLMVVDHLLEGEIGVQAGLDRREHLKFHGGE